MANNAGVRTPAFTVELDPQKLVPAKGKKGLLYYTERTIDPRYEPVSSNPA